MSKRLLYQVLFIYLLVAAGSLVFSFPVKSCTTAVVSGKYTPDGRPLLLKHRDTDILDNKLVIITGGKYRALGLADYSDKIPESIWIGFNDAGFAIMNSASYNLNREDTAKFKDQEGILMKKALLHCATIDDFEDFLENLPKPYGVEANFGVIDARGGAAYFETGNRRFTKIDVNDPKIAPHGYVVRTNYSFTGDFNQGAGYIRFETAEELFYRASSRNDLTVDFILREVSRCVKNSLTGEDIRDYQNLHAGDRKFMYFNDCTVRPSTSASVVIQGIKQGEKAGLTTMWTILGFPLSSVAIPVWLTPEGYLPSILTAPAGEKAPLTIMAHELKNRIVPVRRGNGKNYLQTTAVINAEGTGIRQQLEPLEERLLEQGKQALDNWRNRGIVPGDILAFYNKIDDEVKEFYRSFDF